MNESQLIRENKLYEVNKEGFRGASVKKEKGQHMRLLFFGDSATFGFPYKSDLIYPFLVKQYFKEGKIMM